MVRDAALEPLYWASRASAKTVRRSLERPPAMSWLVGSPIFVVTSPPRRGADWYQHQMSDVSAAAAAPDGRAGRQQRTGDRRQMLMPCTDGAGAVLAHARSPSIRVFSPCHAPPHCHFAAGPSCARVCVSLSFSFSFSLRLHLSLSGVAVVGGM